MNINIGDKNKISNSSIGHQYGSNNSDNKEREKKESFAVKHPIIISILISLTVGFILLFSFWENLVIWIESLFK